MDTMTIGTIAKKAGIGIETIRYYERRNLIAPVNRRPSGYRIFDGSSLQKIRFIKNAQQLGFSLEEIGELLKLRVGKGGLCENVKSKAESKLNDIESKLKTLNGMKRALKGLIESCVAELPTSDCPILKSFEMDKDI